VAEATDGDVDAFAAFFCEAWRQAGPDAPGFTGATDDVIAELTAPAAVRERIGGPERRMFLAWEGDRVVGFSATRHIDDATVELAGIIVLEAMAGRGVGSHLVTATVASAREASYRTMIVRTELTNDRAIGFYEHCGFTVARSAIEHLDDGEVEVCELAMELP
jgi:ribosomal protein S18 acetylase RimI-like enzyme